MYKVNSNLDVLNLDITKQKWNLVKDKEIKYFLNGIEVEKDFLLNKKCVVDIEENYYKVYPENINKKFTYTKADFLRKFINDEGVYILETLDFPVDIDRKIKVKLARAKAEYYAMAENEIKLSDSRVYDMVILFSSLGYTTDTSTNILDGIEKIEKIL